MRSPQAPKWLYTSQAINTGCFIFIFILILLLNSFTPLWGDDWWRAVSIWDFPGIFERISAEYMNWSGRVSVLFLTFLLLLKYPGSVILFNLINSAVLCLLVLGIFRAAIGRYPGKERRDALLVLLTFCCIWLFSHAFGEAALWKTGAIAYLWVITAAIFLITPYIELLSSQQVQPDTRLRLWAWPLFAFFWAMGLENVSVSCVVFMTYCLIAARLRGLHAARWYWHVLLGQGIGTLILVLAPGNFARFAAQDDGQTLWIRFGKLADLIWRHGTSEIYIFIVIAGLILVLALLRHPCILKRTYLWFIFGLTLAFAMLGSTGVNFSGRTSFPAEIAFIVALISLTYPLMNQLRPVYITPLPVLVLLFTWFMADFFKAFDQHWTTWHQTERRNELMENYRNAGIEEILLPSITVPYVDDLKDNVVERGYFLRDIHLDEEGNGWRNGSFATYHGFTFANRLPKPYLIFGSELEDSNRFIPLGAIEKIQAYMRIERHGRKNLPALYLSSEKRYCRKVKEVHVYPKSVKDLKHDEREQRFTSVASTNDVSWINEQGKESKKRCVSRFQLPRWPIEKLVVSHSKLPWPHDVTLAWDKLLSAPQSDKHVQFKAYKEWRGCELRYADTAKLDEKHCRVSSNAKTRGHVVWGPYQKLSPGNYKLHAYYTATEGTPHWDVVVHFPGETHFLEQGALEITPTSGGIMTTHFEIDKHTKNHELEFRIDTKGYANVTLERITIEKLE